MTAWGFRYVSNIVWAKRRKDGGPDGRGVGFYFRNVTELILFGVRGSLRTLPPGRRQVNMIETQKREHSRKPDESYDLIEACSPGPFLELFARYPRTGWSAWGDEAAADIKPRGRQHPAYGMLIRPLASAGAGRQDATMTKVPSLPRGKRLRDKERSTVAAELLRRYNSGKSIRDICGETGYSIGRVRRLLEEAGVEFRRRGGATRSTSARS